MEIRYTRKETKNLGNFNSISIEIACEDTLQNHESVDECYNRLRDFVKNKLDIEFNKKQIVATVKAKISDVDTIKEEVDLDDDFINLL